MAISSAKVPKAFSDGSGQPTAPLWRIRHPATAAKVGISSDSVARILVAFPKAQASCSANLQGREGAGDRIHAVMLAGSLRALKPVQAAIRSRSATMMSKHA